MLREAFRNILPREIVERRKYPLPENEELRLHRLICEELDENIKSTDPRVWRILNKERINQLNKKFRKKIEELERHEETRGFELTKEDTLTERTDVRAKHVFSVLTLIRWFQINFAQKIR